MNAHILGHDEILTRAAGERDARAVERLYDRVTVALAQDPDQAVGSWKKVLNNPKTCSYLAERCGTVVGLVTWERRTLNSPSVVWLFVDPSEYGNKVATLLLDLVSDAVPGPLHLWTRAGNNEVEAFYLHNGWTPHTDAQTDEVVKDEKPGSPLRRWDHTG